MIRGFKFPLTLFTLSPLVFIEIILSTELLWLHLSIVLYLWLILKTDNQQNNENCTNWLRENGKGN